MPTRFPLTQSLTVGTFWRAAPTSQPAPAGHSETDLEGETKATIHGAPAEPTDASTSTEQPTPGTDSPAEHAFGENQASPRLGGLCRIEGDDIEIDVVGAMTPSTQWVTTANGNQLGVRAPVTEIDIHGTIPIAPWKVSFLECRTEHRSGSALGLDDGNSHHVLEAAWALVGAHTTIDARFDGFRVSITGFEEWAVAPGLEQTISTGDTLGTALNYVQQPDVTEPFTMFNEDATIALQTIATSSPLDVHGGRIRRWNRVALTGLSGWTLEEAIGSFVLPLQTLMTLLSGAAAEVRRVEIHVDGRWCELYGRHIAAQTPEEPASITPMLLPADRLTLANMATWLRVAVDLAPTPQVVAAGLSGEFTTVDTEALVLATSAESLDRRLRPNVRDFDEDVIAFARQQLKATETDDRLKVKVDNALKKYLWEPSLPQRLDTLASRVAEAAPDCVGRINIWKRAVTEMRVQGAHGLDTGERKVPGTTEDIGGDDDEGSEAASSAGPGAETDALITLNALAISVRWMLRIRVLQECGVPDQALTTALEDCREYQRDRNQWTSRWPKIYPT